MNFYESLCHEFDSAQQATERAEYNASVPRYGAHLPCDADFVRFSEELDGWLIDLTDGRCWSMWAEHWLPSPGCECGDTGAHELLSFGQDGFTGRAKYRFFCHATKIAWVTFDNGARP